MLCLYIFGFALLCKVSVCFRIAIFNLFCVIRYAVIDIVNYVKYKQWRVCNTGKIICYVGLFGRGKTLSAVHHVCQVYKKYNDKLVYDFSRRKWVTQKVHIISNVELAIPHEKFTTLKQIVRVAERMREIDQKNDTITVTLVLGDEFSVQLNSRSFKSNIDPLFLNTLLTCRHHHISLIYTSQRFNHVDALLRQVTSYVVSCNKCWRFMVHGQYDAYELENASDPTMIKSTRRYGWFIKDSDYAAYDTLACVENLSKNCLDGDMITEEQILALQQIGTESIDQVMHPSRRYLRTRKKMNK